MGDYWGHEVRIEQFLDRDPKKTYPACTGGSGACPPEDCGGTAGYLEWRDEATGYDHGPIWTPDQVRGRL